MSYTLSKSNSAKSKYEAKKIKFSSSKTERSTKFREAEDCIHHRRAFNPLKFPRVNQTYGTTTFENFAREGNLRYQDLWLKNPRDPFGVSSIHSMSQNISEKMEEQSRLGLKSCVNLTKGVLFNITSEANAINFDKFESISNHASASSSEKKLSDISTPTNSSDHLNGDFLDSTYSTKYDMKRPRTVDSSYHTGLFSCRKKCLEPLTEDQILFKTPKRTGGKSDCLDQIRKCLKDLSM